MAFVDLLFIVEQVDAEVATHLYFVVLRSLVKKAHFVSVFVQNDNALFKVVKELVVTNTESLGLDKCHAYHLHDYVNNEHVKKEGHAFKDAFEDDSCRPFMAVQEGPGECIRHLHDISADSSW